MSQGEKMETDAVLVEKAAKGLYEADRDHEATWPLNDDDDGRRGDGAYVRVTPREVVEEYRQHARDALNVVPPLLARPVPMGGQHSIPNGVDTREQLSAFFTAAMDDPVTGPILRSEMTPAVRAALVSLDPERPGASPATVDVGESRRDAAIAELIAHGTGMIYVTDEQQDAIRSLSTTLETEQAKVKGLEDVLQRRGPANWEQLVRDETKRADAAEALARELASPVMSLLTLYDAGRLEMSSEECPGEEPHGPDDPGVPAHPIHDELVWALREAVAKFPPSRKEKE